LQTNYLPSSGDPSPLVPQQGSKIWKWVALENDRFEDPAMLHDRTPILINFTAQTTFYGDNPAPEDPASFSRYLENLGFLTRYNHPQKLLIVSWKFNQAIPFSHNMENRIDYNISQELIDHFNDIIPNRSTRSGEDPDAFQRITVMLKYTTAFEYAYRYLLSTPVGIGSFRRWCLNTESPI